MKLPDGFEGVVIPQHQVFLQQFLSQYQTILEYLSGALSTICFIVCPFIYAFWKSSKVFTYFVYPIFFVTPWVMILFQKDRFSLYVIHLITPFTGILYIQVGLNTIFNFGRKSRTAHFLLAMLYFGIMVLLMFTPLVPFSFRNGILLQYSWPFLSAADAFGTSFYSYLQQGHILDFMIGSVAIPAFAHAWTIMLLCSILNAVKGILCPKVQVMATKTLDDINKHNL